MGWPWENASWQAPEEEDFLPALLTREAVNTTILKVLLCGGKSVAG